MKYLVEIVDRILLDKLTKNFQKQLFRNRNIFKKDQGNNPFCNKKLLFKKKHILNGNLLNDFNLYI